MSRLDSNMLFDSNRMRITPTTDELDIKQMGANLIKEHDLEEAFLVCDIGEIIKKHLDWNTHLPRLRPFYAAKCNTSTLVLKVLAALGTGFDCASKGEIIKVLNLGVCPKNIVYANTIKPPSHIITAASLGVQTMTFDNESELYKLRDYHPGAKLLVRIRCDAEKAQVSLGTKTGANMSDAKELLKVAKKLKLNVVGVTFHVGTGCLDPSAFFRAIAAAKLLFDYAKSDVDYDMKLLDIGGGFPGNTGTSIAEFAHVVNNALDQFFPLDCGVEIIAEPGRYYVASAYTLFTQIISLREVKSESREPEKTSFMYYLNDGVYGSLHCIMLDRSVKFPQILNTQQQSNPINYECSIWGPTCSPLDLICSKIFLPKMKMGEWLTFDDMGAYTLAAGCTFNGFAMPNTHYVLSWTAWNTLKKFMSTQDIKLDISLAGNFLKAGFIALPATAHENRFDFKAEDENQLSCSSIDKVKEKIFSETIPNEDSVHNDNWCGFEFTT